MYIWKKLSLVVGFSQELKQPPGKVRAVRRHFCGTLAILALNIRKRPPSAVQVQAANQSETAARKFLRLRTYCATYSEINAPAWKPPAHFCGIQIFTVASTGTQWNYLRQISWELVKRPVNSLRCLWTRSVNSLKTHQTALNKIRLSVKLLHRCETATNLFAHTSNCSELVRSIVKPFVNLSNCLEYANST